MMSDRLGAMLRVILQSFQAGSDEGENFGRIVFDLFFRGADTARRITGQIIARVSEPAESFAIKNKLARRRQQTSGNAPGSERRRQFLGRADDDRSDVFVRRQPMLA